MRDLSCIFNIQLRSFKKQSMGLLIKLKLFSDKVDESDFYNLLK